MDPHVFPDYVDVDMLSLSKPLSLQLMTEGGRHQADAGNKYPTPTQRTEGDRAPSLCWELDWGLPIHISCNLYYSV